MGPRARARGNDRCGIGQRGRFVASMGPRARARGNERYLLEVAYVFRLQWGHERALVEIKRLCELHGELSCFNGATSARSWKYGAARKPDRSAHASMGPRARARGNRDTRATPRASSGFNGATSARSWKCFIQQQV